MLSLFVYIVINFIIFLFLMRKKYKVATCAHIVLFVILLSIFLFSGAIPSVLPLLNKIFGIKNVMLLRKSLLGIEGVSITPFIAMELAMILLSVVAYFISVMKIVYVLFIRKSKTYNISCKKRHKRFYIPLHKYIPININKLYCRYLC